MRAGDTVFSAWGDLDTAGAWMSLSTALEICISEINRRESKDVREVSKTILISANFLRGNSFQR